MINMQLFRKIIYMRIKHYCPREMNAMLKDFCNKGRNAFPVIQSVTKHQFPHHRLCRCTSFSCNEKVFSNSFNKFEKLLIKCDSLLRYSPRKILFGSPCGVNYFHSSSHACYGKSLELRQQEKKDWENLLDNNDKRENITSIPVKRENIWTIPNLLSLSRIVATPYMAYLVYDQQFSLALGIFFVAGLTDILDGQIARRWPSQQSAFGTALDPLGDKILVTTLTIMLTLTDIIPLLLTTLIVGRDVLLMISVFYLRYRTCPRPLTLKRYFDPTLVNAQLNPTFISKVNTVLQMGVIWLSMCAPVFNFTGHPVLNGLYAITGLTTVWSGLSYIFNKNTVKILKN